MADQDEQGQEEGKEEGKAKRGLPISRRLIVILAFVVGLILLVIFIISVSFLTAKMVLSNQPDQHFAEVSKQYQGKPEVYSYFDLIPAIRTRTSDATGVSVLVKVALGYKSDDTPTHTELVARKSQLTDLIRSYFASKTAADLAPQNEEVLKTDLRRKINNLINGQIYDVIFPQLQVLQ